MLKFSLVSRVVFSLSITIFVVFSGFTSPAKAEIITPTSVFFSEVNFLGSSISASDEWIELYNPLREDVDLSSFFIKINNSTEINLSGKLVKSKSFFIISNFSANSANSNLKLAEDGLVTSSLSLPNPSRNQSLTLQLFLNEELKDEIIFNQNYDAKNKSNGRYSVARQTLEVFNPSFNNWSPSINRKNLKQSKLQGNKCEIDLGTPGAVNFAVEEVVFEIEDLCFSAGEIINEGEQSFLKISNFTGNIFDLDLELDRKNYEVTLIGKAEGSENFSIGNFEVNTNQGKYNLRKITSDFLNKENSAKLKFRNKSKKASHITFSTQLNSSQIILLDKILIREVSTESRKKVEVRSADLPTEVAGEEVVENSRNLKKFRRGNINKDQNLIDNLYLLDAINNSSSIPYMASLSLKADNFNAAIQDFDPIITFTFENPSSGIIKSRTFYKNNFDGSFKNLNFATISEKEGADIFSAKAYGNADIYIENFTFQEIGRRVQNTDYEEIPFVESLNKDLVKNIREDFSEFKRQSGKIYETKLENFCIISTKCNIEINLEAKNFSQAEDRIAKIFIGNKYSDENQSQIFNLRKSDFDSNGKAKISFRAKNISPKSKIVIYSYGNSDLKVEKPKFTSEELSTKQILVSQNNIDWSKLKTLKTDEANGKLLDLLQSKKSLDPQKLSLSYKIKKIENFSSGKDLLKIRIIDDKGNKLAEKVYDENDLEFNMLKEEKLDFEMKKKGKLFVYIYWYGNNLGGRADLEFGVLTF